MVKHVILWKLKEDLSDADKAKVAADMKAHLEGLVGKVEGLISMNIHTQFLDSSNAEVMMDSELTDEASLKAYQSHPAHVEVANTYVRPFVEVRLCADYEV